MLCRLSPFLLLATMTPAPVAAQPSARGGLDQSIDAGAQWALLSSVRDAKPGVQVAWRRWLSPRAGFGLDLRLTQKATTRVFDSPAQAGPEGVRIPAMEGQEGRRISSYGLGGGILGRTVIGRVSLIGGAGPGLYFDRSAQDTTINASQHAGSTTIRSIGLFGLMEMEVRASRHLSGYAGLRVELRDVRDPESSFGYPTVGLRVAF